MSEAEPANIFEHILEIPLEDAITHSNQIYHGVLEDLLRRLRTQEANEHLQKTEEVRITSKVRPAKPKHDPPTKKGSLSKRKLSDVKEKLREVLGKEPHIMVFDGVKLTENEKKQIMASVAVCEMNQDGFGSINADQEFVGKKFGQKGIETQTYSRIVHIGLSYGLIQYTQDSGSLGKVLQRMREKNPAKFVEIFGGGDSSIADSLVTLTTTDRTDLIVNQSIPLSGQVYWKNIRNKSEGRELKKLANQDKNKDGKSDLPISLEIRGRRVQPISAMQGEPPTDIWTGVWRQRFLEAGQVADFQEIQLEFAIANYMTPILDKAKANRVRSALGLAFMVACSIRFGSGSDKVGLLLSVAKERGISLPFSSSEDEEKCLLAIAEAKGNVGSISVDPDETRRLKLLMKDELGFLAEDYYDVSTY